MISPKHSAYFLHRFSNPCCMQGALVIYSSKQKQHVPNFNGRNISLHHSICIMIYSSLHHTTSQPNRVCFLFISLHLIAPWLCWHSKKQRNKSTKRPTKIDVLACLRVTFHHGILVFFWIYSFTRWMTMRWSNFHLQDGRCEWVIDNKFIKSYYISAWRCSKWVDFLSQRTAGTREGERKGDLFYSWKSHICFPSVISLVCLFTPHHCMLYIKWQFLCVVLRVQKHVYVKGPCKYLQKYSLILIESIFVKWNGGSLQTITVAALRGSL